MIKQFTRHRLSSYLFRQNVKNAHSFYMNVIKYIPELRQSAPGEDLWLKKWRIYDAKLTPLAYRIFSHYIGQDINIVPLEICSNICEPVLTPYNYNHFYSDKNSFDLLFPEGTLPKALFRKIRDRWYYGDYSPLESDDLDIELNNIDFDNVIVKPTLLSSGKGVDKFTRKNGLFVNEQDVILDKKLLNESYTSDCIIQQAFIQNDFFNQFNPSSVNTIRIAVYRDSKGIIHPLNSILRIGKIGSVVDNAHAGGVFIGIGKDGVLGTYVCDQFGRKSNEFNNIDFSKEVFAVPNWNEIKKYVVSLTKNVIHQDLIQWDVVIDKKGDPHILEVNVGGFSGWLFQFTSGPMFGDYTDDVMNFSIKRLEKSDIKLLFYRS